MEIGTYILKSSVVNMSQNLKSGLELLRFSGPQDNT